MRFLSKKGRTYGAVLYVLSCTHGMSGKQVIGYDRRANTVLCPLDCGRVFIVRTVYDLADSDL